MAKKIVAVTACTTGIAHTYMAAEKLNMVGQELGYEVKVETQGASGQENTLTAEDIANADAIILAVDKNIDESRFQGRKVLSIPASKAIKDAEAVIEDALNDKGTKLIGGGADSSSGDLFDVGSFAGIYKHIMNGVSYMIPVVVAGGVVLALSFAFGVYAFEVEGSLAANLFAIGQAGLGLMVPVMAAFIGHSIANKLGFAPALIGGFIANQIGAGFLGGLLAGVLAGYTVLFINKTLKMPKTLEGVKAILLVPVLSTLIVGLALYYLIGTPITMLTGMITNFLSSLSGASIVVMGIVFGLLYFDLGGPFSKIVYTFGVALLSEEIYGPMGAAMVCGMVPPLGMALSTFVQRKMWTKGERETGKAALVLGFSFITEGVIPFAASYPFVVLPSCMVGSAVGSIVAFLLNVEIRAPHGGVFLAFIPNAIGNLPGFFIALAAGAVATAGMLAILKPMHDRKAAKKAETEGEVSAEKSVA